MYVHCLKLLAGFESGAGKGRNGFKPG